MSTERVMDGDAIIARLAEQQDCLDAVAAAFVSVAHALLLAGVTAAELRRLLLLAVESA